MQQKDITILNTRMLVQIKGSKTDPFQKGVTLSIGKTEASVCPVAAMQAYLDCEPNWRGPLFRTSIDRYSTHSFRIGAATTATAAGIPDSKIKILGWWSSSVYQRYVWMSLNVLQGIPKAMASVNTISQIWVPY